MNDVISNRLPTGRIAVPEAPWEGAGKIRIVVGVSGSPASVLALRWAAAEADRLSAALEVVMVWAIEPRAHYAPAISAAEYERRHERAVAGLTATVGAVAGYLPSDSVTMTVAQGLPERALVDRSAGTDLLVLGSAADFNGCRSIGPVIRACLSQAHCPVVVVGPEGNGQRDLLLVGAATQAAGSARIGGHDDPQ